MNNHSMPTYSEQTVNEGSTKVRAKLASQFKKYRKSLLKSKTGLIGLIIVLSVIIIAIFAPFIAIHDPAKTNIANKFIPPVWSEGGSWENPLGTDNLGRDIFSRIVFGSRISLLVGICSVILAGIIGMFFGLIAGFYGKAWDFIIMRTVDALLSIPGILLMLIFLVVFGPSMLTLIIVLGTTSWVSYARMMRSETLSVKERDYVRSARAIGAKDFRIIIKYILPNVISSFIVLATLQMAGIIITEASLSFLGLGIQPPAVSWGLMLSDGKNYLATSWWVATFPGLAITITVLGVIFLGDWLRDMLDPKIKD